MNGESRLQHGVVVFLDLAGLPGWGSEAQPTDADTSTIVERHFGLTGAGVRLVQGCTVLISSAGAREALLATMALLREASRSSGSATAGAQLIAEAPDEVSPMSRSARTAAALATIADADRLLIAETLKASLGDGAFAFDPGPAAFVDGDRVLSFAVRRQ